MSTPTQNHKFLTLLFFALAAAGIYIVFASLAKPSAPKGIEGTYEVVHSDNFETGTSTYDYFLNTLAGRKIRLIFTDEPLRVLSGSKIRVKGVNVNDSIRLSAGSDVEVVAAAEATSSGTIKTAVILFNFSNDRSQPFTTAQAKGAVFTDSISTKEYYKEASFGRLILEGKNSPSGEVNGWFTIDQANTPCLTTQWIQNAHDKAVNAGVNLDGYDKIIYWSPVTSACSYGGNDYLHINTTLEGGRAKTVAHELGHTFGLAHASDWNCMQNGTRVSVSSSCTDSGTGEEYGDTFDVMGSGTINNGPGKHSLHFSNFAKTKLGWFGSSNIVRPTQSGTLDLRPIERPDGTVLMIPGSYVPCAPDQRNNCAYTNYYYVEYRQPSFFDSFSASDPAINGVMIRYAADFMQYDKTRLVDTTPTTSQLFSDEPLGVGRTFTDPIRNITIKLISKSATSARVEFTGDFTAPTAPTNLRARAGLTNTTVSWTASTDAVAVAGYMLYKNGQVLLHTTSTSYVDGVIAPAGSEATRYKAVAYDSHGNISAFSNESGICGVVCL